MDFVLFSAVALSGIVFLILVVSLVCFFMVFYSSNRVKNSGNDMPDIPGTEYDAYKSQIYQWVTDTRALPHTEVSTLSYDGLKLYGKLYQFEEGAPIEIMIHGYKGSAERDMSGGVFRAFALGHSALVIDQRASGKSDGRVITFGVKESQDCLSWVHYVIEHIDADAKIILTGISMGAATVMNASVLSLPENVVGILADCGYTSAQAIIKKVIKDMKLSPKILYPFVKLGAMVFGRFNPDRVSPIKAMPQCKLPIIFFHGDSDNFVPFDMSRENFESCSSVKKKLVITPGAGHGLCFPTDQQAYLDELGPFFESVLNERK